MNRLLVEQVQIAQGFLPVAMDGQANNGAWVSLKNYYRCAIVLFKAVGTAGDDPTITVQQAQDVSGTGAKALNFTRVDKKQAAVSLAAVGVFTPVEQAAGNTFTHADLAEQAAIIVIDIEAATLDIEGGFDCIRATIADVGANAQLGAMLYMLHEPRGTASGVLPSALAN